MGSVSRLNAPPEYNLSSTSIAYVCFYVYPYCTYFSGIFVRRISCPAGNCRGQFGGGCPEPQLYCLRGEPLRGIGLSGKYISRILARVPCAISTFSQSSVNTSGFGLSIHQKGRILSSHWIMVWLRTFHRHPPRRDTR